MFSNTTRLDNGLKSRGIARVALVAVILAGGSSTGFAQTTTEREPVIKQGSAAQRPKWEFLIASGTLVPTGAQRGTIKRANLTAAQLSYVVRPYLALTTTLGWARSRDVASAGAPKLDIFTYDAGAEARAPRWNAGHTVAFSPFAGGGAGARSYVSRNDAVDATHQFAPYVSAGGELSFHPGFRRVHVRMELRDYVSGLFGQGTGSRRNDVTAMIGLRITKQAK